MKKIEFFCRNINHNNSIEKQIKEAQERGIITSYTLTTLTAMNARRNDDICLWCDEIWSIEHDRSCLYVPDHNCILTCGKDFEVFAFVKVTKEGLKLMEEHADDSAYQVVDKTGELDSNISGNPKVSTAARDTRMSTIGDAQANGDEIKVTFDSCILQETDFFCDADKVFDEMSGSILSTNQGQNQLAEDYEQEILSKTRDSGVVTSLAMQVQSSLDDNVVSGHLEHEDEKGCTFGNKNEVEKHLIIIEAGALSNSLVKEAQLPYAVKMFNKMPRSIFSVAAQRCVKINSNLPYFQVSNEPLIMFNQSYCNNLGKNVVKPLSSTGFNLFVSSNLPKIFDMKDHYNKLWESKNDYKELLSFSKSPAHTHIFDPGGLYCLCEWRDGRMFILATFLTLEVKGDFKREGVNGISILHFITYNDKKVDVGAIGFVSSEYVSRVDEIQVDIEGLEGSIQLAKGKYINGGPCIHLIYHTTLEHRTVRKEFGHSAVQVYKQGITTSGCHFSEKAGHVPIEKRRSEMKLFVS